MKILWEDNWGNKGDCATGSACEHVCEGDGFIDFYFMS